MRLIKNVIIIFLLIFFFSSLTKNLLDYKNKLQFYQDFKNDYEAEKKKNTELKTEVLKKSDPSEIEKTIRNKLDLLKPGEVAIIMPQPTPTSFVPTPTPLPNYLQWWRVFFSKP